jgi:hypothetical protein
MTSRSFARYTRQVLCAAVVVAGTAACWSVEDPNANVQVGGQVIVYGRITDDAGGGLPNARITVRHHTSLCAGRINETQVVSAGSDGRYRTTFTATTAVGCLSVVAEPVGSVGLRTDSIMNVRPVFRAAAPLDSVAVNLTLRGGIQ